jgi:hypothetical protein
MRRPPRGSDATRRQFLRRAAAGLGVGGLAATAGCLGDLRDDVSPPPSATAETTATPDNALSESAFLDYAERQRERYGDRGVWGTAGTEPAHDTTFVGAWTETVALDAEGEAAEEPADPRAVVDAVAALYRSSIESADGSPLSQLWLWAGARLPGGGTDGVLAATRALRRVEVGVELRGDGAEIGPYSPGTDRRKGPVTVSGSTPGYDGLATAFPIETGVIRVVPERTGFDRNAFAVQWRGDAEGSQSVLGSCEAAWPGESVPSFTLSTRVAADRRRF